MENLADGLNLNNMTTTSLAAEIAALVPEMARDGAENNAQRIDAELENDFHILFDLA